MRLRGVAIGVLNLFRAEKGSLGDSDVTVAQALADIATIAILQNRASVEALQVNDQLRVALASRIVIEQAKGMIAESQHVPMDQAYERLRRHARNNNLRLADVAREIAAGNANPKHVDRR